MEGKPQGKKLFQVPGSFLQDGPGHPLLHQTPTSPKGVLEVGFQVGLIQREGYPSLGPGGGTRGKGILAEKEDLSPSFLRRQSGVDSRDTRTQDEEVGG